MSLFAGEGTEAAVREGCCPWPLHKVSATLGLIFPATERAQAARRWAAGQSCSTVVPALPCISTIWVVPRQHC